MFAMLAVCAALSLVVMSLAVPRELEARRRTRLRAAAGEVGRADGPPRGTELTDPPPLPRPEGHLERVEGATRAS